jgi:hypothetical protein
MRLDERAHASTSLSSSHFSFASCVLIKKATRAKRSELRVELGDLAYIGFELQI